MTVSSGTMPPIELRTEDDVRRFSRRRRSDRKVLPQLPKDAQSAGDIAERPVESAEALVADRRRAEVDDRDVRLGRLIAASIDFVMVPARVRG